MPSSHFVRNFLIIAALSLQVSACASRTDQLASNDLGSIDASNKLASSMLVGNVEGAKGYIQRPSFELSNDDFKETLQKALGKRGLLSPENQPAHYTVDATIHFISPDSLEPWNDLTIALDVKYEIATLPDHTKVWEKDIHTSSTTPALLEGSVWKNFLLTSPAQVTTRPFTPANKAIKDNIAEFLKAIDQWSSQK